MATPQTFTMASGSARFTDNGDAPPALRGASTAFQPRSARFRAGVKCYGTSRRWFLTYGFSSRLPGPHRLAVPVRPVVVGAAYHPPVRLHGQAAPSFTSLLRQTSGKGLSPLPGTAAPRGARAHTSTTSPGRPPPPPAGRSASQPSATRSPAPDAPASTPVGPATRTDRRTVHPRTPPRACPAPVPPAETPCAGRSP